MISFLRGDPSKRLRKILGEADLPSFPRAVTQALAVLRHPSSRPAEIARALQADPGLSVRILRTVNSAAYAPRRRVEALDQAVVLLGRGNVEQLVLAVAVRRTIERPRCAAFDESRFWRAAAFRAATARALAEVLHPSAAGECFTAGMLQDLAVPLLADRRSRDYAPILEAWQRGEEPLPELEREVFGVDHAELGGWVCADWRLPEALRDATALHHDPRAENCPPAVRLSALTDGPEDEDGRERLIEEAKDRFDLPRKTADEILNKAVERGEELAALLR